MQVSYSDIAEALEAAKMDSDVVVISGGSSQGVKDMTAELVDKAADSGVLTHGIAAKPGKPTITGFDKASKTLYIGLPGHPAAALMVYEQVLIWLWHEFSGHDGGLKIRAKVTANIPAAPGRMTFQLVRLTDGDEPEAVPVFARSGMISPMSSSDGYFVMSENTEGIRPGDTVTVHLWR
jgi:molybdopterin molybdotransferase